MLLTLIAEKCSCYKTLTSDRKDIWNLFYHLFIPDRTSNILREHARCLLRASESLEQWNSSSFGKSMRFLSQGSLDSIRNFWVSYAEVHDSTQYEKRARSVIRKRSQGIDGFTAMHGVRAAGPLWIDAVNTMAHAYREYWKTGVVGGNLKDIADLGKGGLGLVNPMFAESSAPGGDYAVHYGTEPLLGFHVAEAFSNNPESAIRASTGVIENVIDVAQAQFNAWCHSFKQYVDKGSVHLELFSGEAIAFCHELQLRVALQGQADGSARAYIKPWTARPLLLDGSTGHKDDQISSLSLYHIIDSSNLSDHVGLINVLTATIPLLRKTHFSVLYSESLLKASKSVEKSLSDVLGSDVATFGLLVGVVPVGLLSGITMEAVANEMAMGILHQKEAGAQQQYRMRIPWTYPESTDPVITRSADDFAASTLEVEWAPHALSAYLFTLYLTMFAHENPANLVSRLERMTITSPYSTDMQRYTRAAMVALLRIIKLRVVTDWNKTMELLIERIEMDRSLLVGSNSIQELYMYLCYFGIWTSQVLRHGPKQVTDIPGFSLQSRRGESGLLAEEMVPALVHLILVVPRERLRVFTSENPDTMGSPALHLSITQEAPGYAYENIFSSIHCSFGKLVPAKNMTSDVEIMEDSHGWMGSANLIVTSLVPAFGLLMGPKEGMRVALVIKTSPEATMKFTQKLGFRMQVFQTNFGDSNKVHVCRNAPGLKSQDATAVQERWIKLNVAHAKPISRSLVKLDSSHRVFQIQQHYDFPQGSAESKALSAGKSVTATENTSSTLTLDIGDTISRPLYFPFHIHGSQSKLRVARKSSWIEVSVPIHTAPSPEPTDSWTQILFPKGCPPSPWSIPKVNLALQPCVSLIRNKSKNASWIQTFLGPVFSDAELALDKGKTPLSTSTAKYDLKQSLNTIFATFAGLNPQAKGRSTGVFQLTHNQSCHTIIFANSLRHDLDLGSILLDCCVVPLTLAKLQKLMAPLADLQGNNPCNIVLTREESILWKRLIPALVERCRTWTHKASCEYQRKGGVAPLSTEENETPLCSCGEGRDLPDGFAKAEKGQWAPYAKYATRMSLAPIFPVPYVEPSMTDLIDRASAGGPSISSASRTPGPRRPPVTEAGYSHPDAGLSEKCDNCGNTKGPFKRCVRCAKTRYCNHACQKADWKVHKKVCEPSKTS